jgi:1A family penicillin-binding protein
MSHGRIARASHRHPIARARANRYRGSIRARRVSVLPPHLLPGVTGRRRKGNSRKLAWLIAGLSVIVGAMMLAFVALVASSVAGVVATVDAYKDVNADLPDAGTIAVDSFQTTRIFDRDGNLLQEIDDPLYGWRTFVTLDEISPDLINATIAAEDSTFWTHYGVEPVAIVRGVLINVSGTGTSGASTISQQLVRSLFPEQIGFDVTYTRKFREAMAAIELERRYSKEDILTMYLNLIFYGERSYGIEAASITFFDKHAKDLNLAEASLLAGLPQRPTDYNPVDNYGVAKQRQRYVLNQMVKYGYITRAEADDAWNVPLNPGTRTNAIQNFPHFVEYVKDYVEQNFGPEALLRGGLNITTSIAPAVQDRAQEILTQQVQQNLVPRGANNAAMVVMVPYTGEVLAMVGSANYDDELIDGQVNNATAGHQPGSSFKPMVYSAAFEAGWSPGYVVIDAPFERQTPTGPYRPQNYTQLNYGAVTVRTALANSLNIPAVKAADYVGVPAVMDVARRMGMTQSFDHDADFYGLSIALGGAEVQLVEQTNAYATFANGGKHVPANPILKVEDSQGNVLYELDRKKSLAEADQAISAEHAYMIGSILTDDQARGMVFTRPNLFEQTQKELDRPTAAKSGTTNNWTDIWTMGFTTDLAIGVWVGNTDNTPIAQPLDGIQGAGPIWSQMMIDMHKNPEFAKFLNGPDGRPIAEEFPRPAGIYLGDLCAATGHRPDGGGQVRQDLLIRGEGPALRCDQLNAWERSELGDAMRAIREGKGRFTGDAVSTINRYASAVGFDSGDVQTSGYLNALPTPTPAA